MTSEPASANLNQFDQKFALILFSHAAPSDEPIDITGKMQAEASEDSRPPGMNARATRFTLFTELRCRSVRSVL